MSKFIKRLFIFLSPIVFLVSISITALWSSHEGYFDLDKILSSKEKYLIGYGYNTENYRYLKWRALVANESKMIWSLGSSRVLQFRKKMFNKSFYNAGFTIRKMNDILPFLQGIPKVKYPKYIILGLDQSWFYKGKKSINKLSSNYWSQAYSSYPSNKVLFKVLRDIVIKKGMQIYFHNNDSLKKIGFNAFINNNGYRNDGSFYYSSNIEKLINNDNSLFYKSNGFDFENLLIGDRYNFSRKINLETLKELRQTLKYCKENNIFLIGFIPPFSETVTNTLIDNGRFNKKDYYYDVSKKYFDEFDFELFDFSSPIDFGSNDNEFIDGVHSSEITMLKMLIKMSNSNSKINSIINEDLFLLLEQRKNNYLIK